MQNQQQSISLQSMTPLESFKLPDDISPMISDQMKHIIDHQVKMTGQQFIKIIYKTLQNQEITDIQLQILNEEQKIVLNSMKNKHLSKKRRTDQYNKLFYKKVFKYAEQVYFRKHKKNRSRIMVQFYKYHFGKIAIQQDVPLANFYHPDKKTKPGLRTGQKTFNNSYVKLLMKSTTFRSISQQYHKIFKKQCISERKRKVNGFLQNILKVIQRYRNNTEKMEQYFRSNKCKIPWNNNDIDKAWQKAGIALAEFTINQSDDENQTISEEYQSKIQIYHKMIDNEFQMINHGINILDIPSL